jgi:hypothetical protein
MLTTQELRLIKVLRSINRLHLVMLPAFVLLFGVLMNIGKAQAITGADWRSGNIIDDGVFYNNNDMSVTDIQNFLNSKVTCDTWGSKASEYGGGTRAQYGASKGYPAPYTCLKDYSQDGKSAAQIIKEAANTYQISTRALIVLLQKEQALVTDEWPWSVQYRSATGYGCPDTAPCDSEYYGFRNQVMKAAYQFRRYATYPSQYRYKPYQNNTIQFNPNAGCGSSNVYIENLATAGLYNYTPYQPNQSALNNLYGTGDGCGAYGNRNFWRLFNDWFGSTFAYSYGGVNYSSVFDANYYFNTYSDIRVAYGNNQAAAFQHFVAHGMSEGRQGSASFDVTSYKNRYPDLRVAFGANLPSYYRHYAVDGRREGRIATGNTTLTAITAYSGVDYSYVYDFNTYINNHSDLKRLFSNDDAGALMHFINYGMSEGRSANTAFNVHSYRATYYDLRRAFGGNLKSYYLHYINNGRAEGRTATSTYYGGVSSMGNTDYSSIYNFNTYITSYSDIKSTFGLDDIGTLSHFINHGMREGRQASTNFNVQVYKARYPDLRSAFGNSLPDYYMHFIKHGKAEGRTAN